MIDKNVSSSNSECTNDNIALMERWIEEVWNERRIETIDELMSPNCVAYFEHREFIGRKQWKELFYDTMLKAIPDLSLEVKDHIAARDVVVSRWEAIGVLSGELFGVSPSNEKFKFDGISWCRIIDGKIVEGWTNWDMSYLFRQLQSELKVLRGTLPTCAYCKKIRREGDKEEKAASWVPIEGYIREHSEAKFTHGMCPDCVREHIGEDFFRKYLVSVEPTSGSDSQAEQSPAGDVPKAAPEE